MPILVLHKERRDDGNDDRRIVETLPLQNTVDH